MGCEKKKNQTGSHDDSFPWHQEWAKPELLSATGHKTYEIWCQDPRPMAHFMLALGQNHISGFLFIFGFSQTLKLLARSCVLVTASFFKCSNITHDTRMPGNYGMEEWTTAALKCSHKPAFQPSKWREICLLHLKSKCHMCAAHSVMATMRK